METTMKITEGYTQCTQNKTSSCADCVNTYINGAGQICHWSQTEGCNSFDGVTNCPNTNIDAGSGTIITPNTTDYSNTEERNAQTLTDIQGLQNIEKDLFTQLEDGMSDETLTPEQKESLMNKINEISQMRTNLYKNLNGMFSFYQNNVAASRDTLVEQSSAVDIVENELTEAKKRMKIIQQDQANKLRLVEINTYYGERYADHAGIMKTIIIICVPIIILTILANSGILPRNIYAALVIIIAVIGLIYIWKQLLYTFSHDNMNYQEYNWPFKTSQAPPIDTTTPEGTDNPWQTTGVICSGSACCYDGTTYDPTQNKCVPPPPPSDATDAATGSSSGSAAGTTGTAGSISTGAAGASMGMPMGGFGGI